ncbi:MAG: hypothetical protein KDB66_00920 [Solirubrobacterales bacterium]|nr:hypothetical protein [Solirubrobacterales bacterium]MCB8914540.1 hypothetical protein [Thermoleophilales bacterium]
MSESSDFPGQPEISDRLSRIPKNESSPVVGYILLLVGVGMVAYGITALWFGMRDVMDVGGYCAEGGPYVIQQHCPDGAELLMFTGIPVGIIGLFVAMAGAAKSAKGAMGLLLLGWPAIFISLGYNFIDYAINPPEGMGSTVGWWVCGVIFALMGLPALAAVPMLVKAIQPNRRSAVLAVFSVAAVIGVIGGILVANSVD